MSVYQILAVHEITVKLHYFLLLQKIHHYNDTDLKFASCVQSHYLHCNYTWQSWT